MLAVFSRSKIVRQALGFTTVSGLGLTLDVGLLLSLVHFGVSPGIANLFSATSAVVLVYFFATYKVFRYAGSFAIYRFFAYVIYQIVAILAASLAVNALTNWGSHVLLSKALILPVTFSLNFLVLKYLAEAPYVAH